MSRKSQLGLLIKCNDLLGNIFDFWKEDISHPLTLGVELSTAKLQHFFYIYNILYNILYNIFSSLNHHIPTYS